MKFDVIDQKTGKYPDIEKVVMREWVKYHHYDMESGFYIDGEGTVIAIDKCGNTVYCTGKNVDVKLTCKKAKLNVLDLKTGEYPDLEHIARTEEWAQNLVPCDMEGFCINEDGNLLLMDECGNYAYCPPDRFKVFFDLPVYSTGD